MAAVVLVGRRDAALEAALRLKREVFYVGERAPLRRHHAALAGWRTVPFEDDSEHAFLDSVCQLLNGRKPEAVLALTERAVLPAARLREALNLPGNSVQSARWCRDKFAMKRRIRDRGIRCTDFARISVRTTASSLVSRLGVPMVLKPTSSSGSRGTVLAHQLDDVERALAPGMLAETFVHGLEMSMESFVVDGRCRFTNPTEYLLPLWANVVPATLHSDTLEQVVAFNEAVIKALDIRQGMTHLELFLTPDGPVFSEIAMRPPGGYLMDLLGRAYAFDPWQALLRAELGLETQWPTRPSQYAGVWLMHPGSGTVSKVRGLKTARAAAGIDEVHCRVQQGDALGRREGSGECAAHVVASGATRSQVVAALQLARRSLVIEVQRPQRNRSRRRRAA